MIISDVHLGARPLSGAARRRANLNSGDWIESLTAIAEHLDGRFELVDFVSFVEA